MPNAGSMLLLICLIPCVAPAAFSPAEVAAWLLHDCSTVVCETSSSCRATPCGDLDGIDVVRAAQDLQDQYVDGLLPRDGCCMLVRANAHA